MNCERKRDKQNMCGAKIIYSKYIHIYKTKVSYKSKWDARITQSHNCMFQV